MTTDAIAPTPEWMAKNTYQAPQVDQQTNRRCYRKVSVFEEMHNRGEIEFVDLKAAQKLQAHWEGAQGCDVRIGSESGSGEPLEYARSYHSQMVAKAKAVLRPREWLAMQDMLMGATLETVGRKWRAIATPKIARAQGLTLVCGALEALAVHWQFKR